MYFKNMSEKNLGIKKIKYQNKEKWYLQQFRNCDGNIKW